MNDLHPFHSKSYIHVSIDQLKKQSYTQYSCYIQSPDMPAPMTMTVGDGEAEAAASKKWKSRTSTMAKSFFFILKAASEFVVLLGRGVA